MVQKREETQKQPFYLNEEMGILFLLKDWQSLSEFTKKYSSKYNYNQVYKMEYFGYLVIDKVKEQYDQIVADLNLANIQNEHKDFLI